MEKRPLTRRDFIRLVGVTAGASVIAACTPQTVEVVQTQVVKETSIVKETAIVKETVESVVEKVVTATAAPTEVPEPAVLDVWWNTAIPDLT